MSRFNTPTVSSALRPGDTTNLAGGEAFSQSPQQELAAILLTSMIKDEFYTSADDTMARIKELLPQVEPEFAAKAAIFARDEFGMRSVSHVVAAELAGLKLTSGHPWAKSFFDRIVVRTDDMMEIVSYYLGSYGKPLPNALRKGFAQAFNRLDSYKLAKYRAEDKATSLVDVVNLVRPKPTAKNRAALAKLVDGTLRNDATWESRMSATGGNTEAKADVWAGLMNEGRMPYFALLRNLRNIEQTGNSELIERAAAQLVEDEPGKHRILPFRFLTAYGEVSDRRLVTAVSQALDRACVNVPKLEGKTLIVIDHSGSMGWTSTPGSRRFIGDTFAAILYRSNDAEVMVFGTDAGYVGTRGGLNPADSTLTLATKIGEKEPPGGHGTNFPAIFDRAKGQYARFVIFSDMQAWIGYNHPGEALRRYEQRTKAKPYLYAFDLAGHGSTQFPGTRQVQLAGFSEKIFDTMRYVESDRDALVKRIERITL